MLAVRDALSDPRSLRIETDFGVGWQMLNALLRQAAMPLDRTSMRKTHEAIVVMREALQIPEETVLSEAETRWSGIEQYQAESR